MSKNKTLSMGGIESNEEIFEEKEDPKVIELEKEKIQLENTILALQEQNNLLLAQIEDFKH